MSESTDDPADLTPEDEAHVHELLAALPDPELPSDVEARIAAALAAPDATAGAATVLPAADRSSVPARPGTPSGRWRHPRLLQAAAVLVIFALVGAAGWGIIVARSDNGGPGTVAGSASGTAPVTASGTAYTPANLAGQVDALLTGEQAGQSSKQSSEDTADSGGSTAELSASTEVDVAAVKALMQDPQSRQRCLDELSGVPGEQAVAIDVGSFNAQPAAVIVLPNADDAATLDVWVVGPTCSDADNPFPYRYQPVPRP